MIRRFKRPPILTLAVVLLTATVSIVGLTHPPVLRLLQRHPAEAGRPWAQWHLLTSLLVHDGWAPLAFNLIGLAIVGSAVERRIGAARWLVLYLAGGLAGEIAGLWWQPVGAGNSVACFGLVGGLFILTLLRERTVSFAAVFATEWIVIFAGLAIAGVRGAVIAGVLCCPLPPLAMRPSADRGRARRLVVAVAVIATGVSLLLCAIHDIHGPPILAGAIVATLFNRSTDAGSTRG